MNLKDLAAQCDWRKLVQTVSSWSSLGADDCETDMLKILSTPVKRSGRGAIQCIKMQGYFTNILIKTGKSKTATNTLVGQNPTSAVRQPIKVYLEPESSNPPTTDIDELDDDDLFEVTVSIFYDLLKKC